MLGLWLNNENMFIFIRAAHIPFGLVDCEELVVHSAEQGTRRMYSTPFIVSEVHPVILQSVIKHSIVLLRARCLSSERKHRPSKYR